MAEEQPQEERRRGYGLVRMTMEAFAFNKIIVIGLLLVLMSIVGVSAYLSAREAINAKSAEFVLAFFKDMALIIVCAIAGLLQSKHNAQE
jgi:hypothetical protein